MKKIKRVLLMALVLAMLCNIEILAAVDYKSMTSEELDIVIETNNATIETRTEKLTSVNNKCIELIKQNTKYATPEFNSKINEYTANLREYTEKIKVQKELCQKRSIKLSNAVTNNKKKSFIKRQQIKYINSQNKLASILRKATKNSNEMKKYIKNYNKSQKDIPAVTTKKLESQKLKENTKVLEKLVSN